jgi:5-methylcytosine-specific restriction protein A
MPWINNPKRKRKDKYFNNPTTSTHEGKSIYDNREWKNLRARYRREHPLCELCLLEDRSTPTEEIHHKQIISTGSSYDERWRLLTDENNLMALCIDCHNKLHTYAKQHGLIAYNQMMKIKEMEVKEYNKTHSLFGEEINND